MFRIDELQDAGASLARLFGVIGLPSPTPREGVAAPRRGAIDVQDLDFAHRPGQRDLDAVSMSAEPGEKIAVVGASGAGKTSRYRVVPLETHRTTPLGLLSPEDLAAKS